MIKSTRGFTLIELIITLVILVIVSVGISGFIRSSVQIFSDVTEREQLLGDSRFVIERITREARNAVPGSIRVSGNSSVHCLQFAPIDYSTFYIEAPILPTSETTIEVVAMGDINGNAYVPDTSSTFAFIFPTRNVDVYDSAQNRRQSISACSDDGSDSSCATLDDSDNITDLTVSGGFAADSPADRIFFASTTFNYCVRDDAVYFHQAAFSETQPLFTSGGALMAENVSNVLSSNPAIQTAGSDDPFRVFDATLLRNAFVQLRLRFERNEEVINFNHEVHVANVP
jgi:MSHA biogenesis protein MshO